jgi:hypothetical protein
MRHYAFLNAASPLPATSGQLTDPDPPACPQPHPGPPRWLSARRPVCGLPLCGASPPVCAWRQNKGPLRRLNGLAQAGLFGGYFPEPAFRLVRAHSYE